MYYRRKIILSLLQEFGGILGRTDFQKLLFLFNKKTEKTHYDFVPYKYGCFSFQAQQDISTMIKYNLISKTDEGWHKIDNKNYLSELSMSDRIKLTRFYSKYKDLRGNDLVKHVYENYPYYAINSEIAERILDTEKYAVVRKSRPTNDKKALYTIGYEGRSVEEYANILLKHDIKILCDVRKNALSMKYGFSKNQLKNVLENVGIEYIHIPALGIETDKRKKLESYEDYLELFEEYKNSVLLEQKNEIDIINKLLNSKQRVALTCFEADHKYCHRSRVADEVSKNMNNFYSLIHL